MNRIQTLSRILQHLCTAGQGLVVFVLGLATITRPYRVDRILFFLRYNHSWLARFSGLQGRPLLLLSLSLWGILWLLGLGACRGIFRAHAQGEAFQAETQKGFRLLAIVWIAAFPLACLLAYAPERSILAIVPTLLVHLGPKLVYLLIGMALLVVARIMDEACHLQDEQDLVV